MNKDVKEFADIGRTMARIRKEQQKKWSQEDVAKELHIDRSVYTKYENGKLEPPLERILAFAALFQIQPEELKRRVAAAIPDTSALLKNRKLLSMLLEDYKQVIIPDTVQIELDKAKDRGNKAGWQQLMAIAEYRKKYSDKLKIGRCELFKEYNRDAKIRRLAAEIARRDKVEVYIVHDDAGMTNFYDNSLLLRDYMETRYQSKNYASVLALEEEYCHLDYYYKIVNELNLDMYLPDGLTLLISCIRHNYDIKTGKRKGDFVADSERFKKLRFLLEHGADINKTDCKEFCLTPLAHCVQIDDFKAFCMLIEYGADFNKGSIDEMHTGYYRTQNEGNTPLMAACWHGRKKYIEKLCSLPDLCLNQQDGNGYTALMKCAIQGSRRKKKGRPFHLNEELYKYLLSHGADPLIRDRKNRTAKQLWKEGVEADDCSDMHIN